jgi:hypothetical protein
MCLYAKYIANMTQVSDVAHGPLVSSMHDKQTRLEKARLDCQVLANSFLFLVDESVNNTSRTSVHKSFKM